MVMRFADREFLEPDFDEIERRRLERERAAAAAIAPPVATAPLPVPIAPVAPIRVSTAPFDVTNPLAGDDPVFGGSVASTSPGIIFGPNIDEPARSPNQLAQDIADYTARQERQAGLDAQRFGGANAPELAAINARPVTEDDGFEIQRDPLTGGIVGYRAPGDANFTLDRRPSTAQELLSAPTFEEYLSRASNAEFGSPDRAFALANSNFAVDPFHGRTFQPGPSLAERRELVRMRNEGEARQAAFEAQQQSASDTASIQPGQPGAAGGRLGDRFVEQGGTTIRTNREGTETGRMGPDGRFITAPAGLPTGATVTEQGAIVDAQGNQIGRLSTLGGYPVPLPTVATPAFTGPTPEAIASQNRAALDLATSGQAPVMRQTAPDASGQTFSVVGRVTGLGGEVGAIVEVNGSWRIVIPETGETTDIDDPRWGIG